jgi:hypothetical protein
MSLRRWVKIILPFLGLALFGYLIYTLGVNTIISVFLTIDPRYVLAALAITPPLLVIRVYAWKLIASEQHITLGFGRMLKVFLIGVFYGTPSPGYFGQLMRVPYLKEETGQPYGKLFVNTVLETFIHTLSLYGMMVVGAVLVASLLPELLWFTALWLTAALAIFVFLLERRRGDLVFKTLIRFGIPRTVRAHASAFTETFYQDFPRLRSLLLPLVLGAITWLMMFSQEYLIALSMGLDIPYLPFLVLFPIANVVGFIPISIGGLGTREAAAIFIFTSLFAVTEQQVFVLSLAGFMVTDVVLAVIGFFLSLTEARQKLQPVPSETESLK